MPTANHHLCMMIASWFALLTCNPLPVAAQPAPQFELPVACQIGAACLVQKLFDHQPGPGVQDYRCGRLTTEDHHGTDIRLRRLSDMARGTAVVAAASGRVLRVRDGMADTSVRQTGQEAVKNRMAGNAVVIAHGDGWESQYSHLRNGSVRVKAGDIVAAGDTLGLIGMSGNAEFPHLHFEIRQAGVAQDPFQNPGRGDACNASENPSNNGLWSKQAARALYYVPTAAIAAGFAAQSPEAYSTRGQTAPVLELAAESPALVMWVDAFGVQAGDEELVVILGPDGKTLINARKTLTKSALSWFSFTGKKRRDAAWPIGRYAGHYQLMRNGKKVADIRTEVMVK
jgi:murein DD-endopeptidase MepM/ murein hydrolase activator NlpD